MSAFFTLQLFLATVLTVGHAGHWSYNGEHGPRHWAEMYSTCGGSSQSPIDLQTNKNNADFVYDETLTNDLDFVHGTKEENYYLVNNGHTVFMDAVESEISMFGANLGKTYRVLGPHFHWGSKNSIGSEHTFNGVQYPLELHIVTYDAENYGSINEAVESNVPGALAVVGVMFKVVKEDNPVFAPIFDNLEKVHHPDKENKVKIPYFPFKDLLPAETSEYFRYSGSLTTPMCNEVVTWTLMVHPQTISQAQLDKLRDNIHEGDDEEGNPINMLDNYRYVQPLNGRTVTKSFVVPLDDNVVTDPGAQEGDDASRPLIGQFVCIIAIVTTAILL